MSRATHTPGPWRTTRDAQVLALRGQYICCVGDQDVHGCAVDKANARLIAAAPDLLAAAKLVIAGLNARIEQAPSDAAPVFNGITDLHLAINKAEGTRK